MPRLKRNGSSDDEDYNDTSGGSVCRDIVCVRIPTKLRDDILKCELPGSFRMKLTGLLAYYCSNTLDSAPPVIESEAEQSFSEGMALQIDLLIFLII